MRKLLVALLTLALSACATAQRLGAANDVRALLVSIRDNDHAAFDAHVDHEALKADLQSKIEQQLSTNKKMKGLAALLGPSTLDLADQLLVQPKTFRMVAEQYGYRADTQIPGPIAISQALKTLPDGRVCATKKKDGPCLLVFTREGGVWKLTGFEGDSSMLRLKL
ncbi:MAG TPA: hypothetical protein VHN39_18835 [Phenylobacterium sp.]|jgi:hypothetical protein|nr:hypothetical protein [Phenylobacterium sp.]